jgi:enamine deaminase RidA (YjgF/YER057c/UK114 family)
MHAHLDAEGECKEAMHAIKNMVAKVVSYMPNVTSFTIVLASNNTFLFHHPFNEHGEGPMELLKGKKLNRTMSKFASMCPP